MKLAEFNKLSKNCPWLYQPYSYSTKLCKAASIERFATAYQDTYESKAVWGGNIQCCKKNCAVLYWLNRK